MATDVEKLPKEPRLRRDGTIVRRGGPHPPEIDKRTDAECRLWAVQIAADMEMGYYIDRSGNQWDARPMVMAELLRFMGYSPDYAADNNRPTWWPGADEMRRMVSLKVMLRQAQGKAGTGGIPWLDAALAASVEELLDRLYGTPKVMGNRELIELTTKLARLREQHRGSGNIPAQGTVIDNATGSRVPVAIQRITETIIELPDEERIRMRGLYERATARAMEQIGAGEAATPE